MGGMDQLISLLGLYALFLGCLFITGGIVYLKHHQTAANYPRIVL
jgi:hypothetical protein